MYRMTNPLVKNIETWKESDFMTKVNLLLTINLSEFRQKIYRCHEIWKKLEKIYLNLCKIKKFCFIL